MRKKGKITAKKFKKTRKKQKLRIYFNVFNTKAEKRTMKDNKEERPMTEMKLYLGEIFSRADFKEGH